MSTFIWVGIIIQSMIILASIMGYISAGQYMKEARSLIKQNPSNNRKMWLLVIILPVLYIVLPLLGAKMGMRSSDLSFPIGILMYAFMFIGTKKILGPLFEKQKDKLWKFAVIYPGATFLLNIALTMIASRVVTYMILGF